MATGDVHGVVVGCLDVLQPQRRGQLLSEQHVELGALTRRLLRATDRVGRQAALIHGGADTAGSGEGELNPGLAEGGHRGEQLLGPEASRVLCAVGESPVVGTGDDDEY